MCVSDIALVVTCRLHLPLDVALLLLLLLLCLFSESVAEGCHEINEDYGLFSFLVALVLVLVLV